MTSVVAKDDLWCAVASSMCVRIYFGWNLQYVRYIFRLCRFFSSSPKNDDWNYLPFGVNYVSVAQKLRILAILPLFDPKHSFLADSIDDRRKIKAEILSFKMRCYVYKIKLRVRLRLRVVTIKNASYARLRVQRALGLRSCRCGKSKWVTISFENIKSIVFVQIQNTWWVNICKLETLEGYI